MHRRNSLVAAIATLVVAFAATASSASAEVTPFGKDDCFCSGITVGNDGSVFLADPNTNRVVKYGSNLVKSTAFSGLNFAWGLATTPDGNVVVISGNVTPVVIDPNTG